MQQQIISPVDNQVLLERELASEKQAQQQLDAAQAAQQLWQNVPLSERKVIIQRFIEAFQAESARLAREVTLQMGRPIKDTPGEIKTACERAKAMLALSEQALQNDIIEDNAQTKRAIKHVPVGTVLLIAPWNYPYLTCFNGLIPSLLAGNSVIIKHAAQTGLCAENICRLLESAGLPANVCQFIHTSHDVVAQMMNSRQIHYTAFTGSVAAGKQVSVTASQNLMPIGLELGGKDAAYVRYDANLDHVVAALVDGAFYNAGQSCCGIERIYVDHRCYDNFVEQYCALVQQYRLANPLEPTTSLGPMVNITAANTVRAAIMQAQEEGATALISEQPFGAAHAESAYCAPQVLVDVRQEQAIMQQESFGPVVAIMPVKNDRQAIEYINDSRYGLTASVWSEEVEVSEAILNQLQVGTVFLNRCDYLDPYLAWTGVKETGYGCSLSKYGFYPVTRRQSLHLIKPTSAF